MAVPGPGYSITMRIAAPPSAPAAGDRTTAVGRGGTVITGVDIADKKVGKAVARALVGASRSRAHIGGGAEESALR